MPDLPVKILGRQLLGGLGHRRRPLPRRPHVPGRRRGARDAADRRLRHEYRRAGRAEPRLEARRGAAGPGRRGAARYLPCRAPAARMTTTKASLEQQPVDGAHRAARTAPSCARPEFLNEQGLIFGAVYQSPRGRPGRLAAAGGRRSGDALCAFGAPGQPGAACLARTPTASAYRRSILFGDRFRAADRRRTAAHGSRPRRGCERRTARAGCASDRRSGEFADPDGQWRVVYGLDARRRRSGPARRLCRLAQPMPEPAIRPAPSKMRSTASWARLRPRACRGATSRSPAPSRIQGNADRGESVSRTPFSG